MKQQTCASEKKHCQLTTTYILFTEDFTLHHMEKRIDPADGASYTFKDISSAENDLNSEIA